MDPNRQVVDRIHKEVLALPGKSEPGGWYSADGDCLFFYAEDVPYYGVRLTEHVTVFEAVDDERPVGIQIKGIRSLISGSRVLKHMIKLYIERHADIYMGFLFIVALEQSDSVSAHMEPEKVNRVAKWSVPVESLAEAAT